MEKEGFVRDFNYVWVVNIINTLTMVLLVILYMSDISKNMVVYIMLILSFVKMFVSMILQKSGKISLLIAYDLKKHLEN